jgi:hypothetical protein
MGELHPQLTNAAPVLPACAGVTPRGWNWKSKPGLSSNQKRGTNSSLNCNAKAPATLTVTTTASRAMASRPLTRQLLARELAPARKTADGRDSRLSSQRDPGERLGWCLPG